MTLSLHEVSVGMFVPFLRNLSGLLDKAASYAEVRKIDPAILLGMRLYPDMYDLSQQVGEAIRHAVIASSLLAGREPLPLGASKPNLAELKGQIWDAIDFIESLPQAEIDAAGDREVAFRLKSGVELPFTGRSLLLTFTVPQFFFHVTTAYDILRHAGVDLVKRDFLGRR